MQGADFGLVHTQRRKKPFLSLSTSPEVWTDLSLTAEYEAPRSKSCLTPLPRPVSCTPAAPWGLCPPGWPPDWFTGCLGYLQGSHLGALGFLPQSATWEKATKCRPQPHTPCPALPPLVALCMAWTPMQVPGFLARVPTCVIMEARMKGHSGKPATISPLKTKQTKAFSQLQWHEQSLVPLAAPGCGLDISGKSSCQHGCA